jgi:hypothetical protein
MRWAISSAAASNNSESHGIPATKSVVSRKKQNQKIEGMSTKRPLTNIPHHERRRTTPKNADKTPHSQ